MIITEEYEGAVTGSCILGAGGEVSNSTLLFIQFILNCLVVALHGVFELECATALRRYGSNYRDYQALAGIHHESMFT